MSTTRHAYGADRAQYLLIAKPSGAGPFPVVFSIHGGGWEMTDPTISSDEASAFLGNGLAIVSISYRTGRSGKYDAQIDDARLALEWLRTNAAANNLDASRLCFSGDSAGGFAAAWMGVLDSAAKCVTTAAAPVDLTKRMGEGDRNVSGMLGGHDRADASPLFRMTAAFPPTMIVHGRGDRTISVTQGRAFRDKLISLGVAVEYLEHSGGHRTRKYAERAAFAKKYLIGG